MDDHGKCIRRFARIARKNVMFLLNQGEIVPYIARNVTPGVRIVVVRNF